MDMSTHSAAESLDGVVDVPVPRGARVAQEVAHVPEERAAVEPFMESIGDVPMQFVRVGLPAAIFLWVMLALVGYIAFRSLVG